MQQMLVSYLKTFLKKNKLHVSWHFHQIGLYWHFKSSYLCKLYIDLMKFETVFFGENKRNIQ